MELDLGAKIDETWHAMEDLVEAGLVRNIGVANFRVQLLQHLRSIARIAPQVNQVELHPFLVQEQLLRFCAHTGTVVTGFSPLGAGSYVQLDMATEQDSVLEHPAVLGIAKRLGKTPAQVVLRWSTARGCSVVVKSSKIQRLSENINIFDFDLSAEDMKAITKLDQNRRFNDPGVFCTGMGACVPIFG
eukprot:TRINITY_DN10020_c0_g1_i14.p1 TRINITY_DN10020_c0_g1~~TRINITY_DN10020_c0_g1_i14.p1  ORF type:complete len:188 (+),score=35.36 TRINITY_DN10020_c0_g1_i14:251-814(+)